MRAPRLTTAVVRAVLLSPLAVAGSCSDRSERSLVVEPRAPGEVATLRGPVGRDGAVAGEVTLDPQGNALADRIGLNPGGLGVFGALFGKLPSTDTVTSGVPAFEIKQKGGGIAGRFEVTNPNSAAIALDGVNAGTGHALLAWNYGRGRGATVITSNSQNTLPALDVSSQSTGTPPLSSTSPGLASAMDVRANNTTSTIAAAAITTLGQGVVLRVNHRGPTGDLAVFQVAGGNKIRFNRAGWGIFNGGTQTGGADVAEAFETEGRVEGYEPGDVLAISTRSDRKVTKSRRAYSTAVIGVYATKPGVLLTDRDIDDGIDGMIPVGVVGVIPTKVSAENGTIHRGDLLVAARTPGHAMRGTDRGRMLGAVVGKALAEFKGPGTGVIKVLVNVR
jgi:trimeric autotransporter adhesin